VITNENGPILNLQDAKVKTISLPSEVICPQYREGKETCDETLRVNLSGFVYTLDDNNTWKQWLHLIARHTRRYEPQPYQQLADVLTEAGRGPDAQQVRIDQQEDYRRRGNLGG
jgi:hypothetical protein